MDALCRPIAGEIDAAPASDAPFTDAQAPIVDGAVNDAQAGCPEGWWDCTYLRRRKLSFGNEDQAEALVGFPVLVSVNNNRIDYGMTQDTGQDLRFIDSDGAVLPHEIERWNEAGTSSAWVRVPQIDASSNADYIWMYYGNDAVADGQAEADVWTGYSAVWHLDTNPANGTFDSTANNNNGTANPAGEMGAANRVAGKIGRGLFFDGVDDWIQVAHSDSLDIVGDQLTLSAWVRMTATQTVDGGLIVKSSEGPVYNYHLGLQTEDTGNLRATTDGTGEAYLTGQGVLAVDTWFYVTGTYDGVTAKLFVNATLDGSQAATGNILSAPNDALLLGRRRLGDERFFVGRMDEARVAAVARSEDWISAQYLSMTNAFVTFADEESAE